MDDQGIAALRMAYNVAVSAHADCARSLTEALMRGGVVSEALILAESKARAQKEEARRKLHAALARSLGPPREPPDPSKPAR
jgi:hypothetical protein